MNAIQTAMQAYATAGLYNAQLTNNYATMAQMSLANNAVRSLAPSFGNSAFGKGGSSLSGLTFGDAFTKQSSSAANASSDAGFSSTGAEPSLLDPMQSVAKIQQEEKRLNILQMISSVFERIYASMLKALGRKPESSSSKQDGPTE